MAVRSQNQSKKFFSSRFEVHIPKLCFGDVAHDFKKIGARTGFARYNSVSIRGWGLLKQSLNYSILWEARKMSSLKLLSYLLQELHNYSD